VTAAEDQGESRVVDAPGSTVRARLAATRLLSSAPPEVVDDLAQRVETRRLDVGAVLCREGEQGGSAFLITAGRFVVERQGREIESVGRGELVGEMSLLTGEPRVATVTAVRAGSVLELSAPAFDEVLARHPSFHRAVTRQVVDRLSRAMSTVDRTRSTTVVAVLHDGSSAARDTVDLFLQRLGPRSVIITGGSDDLTSLETTADLVVINPDPADPKSRAWAFAHCDRALAFVDATANATTVRSLTSGPAVDLVLVHPRSTACPHHTRRWLDTLTVPTHHHIRNGDTDDVDRLTRRVTNREIVLVLSGGGARGMAHIGLWAAMTDHGIPIDAVVGVSAGAVVGAVMAMGLTPAEGGRLATELFADRQGPIDLTIPTVALAAGTRINDRLRSLCGPDRRIEDLWLPLTIVSTNLTTGGVHLHRDGPLWRAVRASTAIPGVFPPVPEPDGLLVDGGVVANLPIEVARRRHTGAIIIASDVSKKMQLAPDGFPAEAEIGGFKALRRRLRRQPGARSMVSVLAQVTALGGAGANLDLADTYLAFDLDRYGMFDFRKGQAIIDEGRRQAEPTVETLADLATSLRR
jgi:predicted acylesterase/phospholipase RssA/CRP-like cAMP-binding protein